MLDTTVLIDILRNRHDRRRQLAELVKLGHTLATGAINIGELYAGMRSGEEEATANFLSSLDCYPITLSIARRAGTLKYTASRRGRTLALADMLVAATALEHDLTLITDNRKDFPLSAISFHDLV